MSERGNAEHQTAAPKSWDAFISYASENREKAEDIRESLEAKGLKCWIAPRDVRASFEYGEEIINGIRNSRCLVLVLSNAANRSFFVKREVERAVNYGKPVFPIRVEEVLPSPSLELFVSSAHWIDAWSGKLAEHVDAVIHSIQGTEGMSPPPRSTKQRWLRMLASNLKPVILVCSASALSVGAIWYLINGSLSGVPSDSPSPSRSVSLKPEDVRRSDFIVQGFAAPAVNGGNVYQVSLLLGPAPGLYELLEGAAVYLAYGDDNFRQVDTSGGLGYNGTLTAAQTPKNLKLKIITTSGKTIGPFTYETGFWTNHLKAQNDRTDAMRQQAAQNLKAEIELMIERDSFLECKRFLHGITNLTACSIRDLDLLKQHDVVRRILVGTSSDSLTLSIPIASGVNDASIRWSRTAVLLNIDASELHYRVEYADGSLSHIVVPQDMGRTNHSVDVQRLPGANQSQPPLYLAESTWAASTSARDHSWLISGAGGDVAQVTISDPSMKLYFKRRETGFFALELKPDQYARLQKFWRQNGSKLTLEFTMRDGTSKAVNYSF